MGHMLFASQPVQLVQCSSLIQDETQENVQCKAYVPAKNTQGIPSNYNVGAECHQRDVQVWCIDILDRRFVR